MAFEADRVVVELIADVENFDVKVKQSATSFDQSMNKIVSSAKKAENANDTFTVSAKEFAAALKASGNDLKKTTVGVDATGVAVGKLGKTVTVTANQTASSMSRFSNSVLSSGAQLLTGSNPFTVLARQGPAVASALRLVNVAGGAVGAVLGGVVVAGALAAGAALIQFILKTDDTTSAVNDLVEKLKENAEKTHHAEQANAIFAGTIEGVTAALDANQKIIDKLNDSTKTAARLALENALVQAEYAKRIRETNVALLEQAEAQLLVLQAQSSGGRGGLRDTGATAEAKIVESRIATLRGKIVEATVQLNLAAKQVDDTLSRRVVERAQEMADPVKRINKLYDKQIEAVRKLAVTNKTVTSELNKQVKALEAQRAAALKAERDRNRVDNSNRQSGRRVDFAGARAIAEAAGFQVNSGQRTFAQQAALFNNPAVNRPGNPVARPGTSAHEGVRGKWALDIQFAPGLTPGKIRKTFGDQGVALSAVFKEKGHFHVEGSTGAGGRRGPSAETLAKRAEASRIAEENKRQAFQNELAALQQGEIDARQALVDSAEEIAALEIEAIELSRQKYNDNLAHLQSIGRLQEGEVLQLTKINDERAKLRTELVLRREAERKRRLAEQNIRAAEDFQGAARSDQTEILQGQHDLARTAKERAAIERKLLDLQFQEERARLQSIISYNERLKLTKGIEESERIEAAAAAARAEIALQSLPQRQANAQASGDRANASPLQSYFGDIQAQADDLNTAFEQIAAGGLATFTDALTNAIVNFTSLGDVGRAVLQALTADLVKMAIQQVLLKTVGAALGSAATATTVAQAAAAGAAWAPAAAAASLATLGANAGPAAAALASTHALSMALAIPKREGGAINGPGGPTDDRVLVAASNGEFMIRARSAQSIGYAALDHMNKTGRMPGYANGGRIRSVSPVNMAAASPNAGRGRFSPQDIQMLRGIVGDAVSALPNISLHASFDPAEAMQRALGSPAGEKALIAALGRNSGRVKATLQ